MNDQRIRASATVVLINDCESAETALKELIDCNIKDIIDDSRKLKEYVDDLKSSIKQYNSVAHDLILRYGKTGQHTAENELRKFRRNLREETNEKISIVNSILCDLQSDVVSNITIDRDSLCGDISVLNSSESANAINSLQNLQLNNSAAELTGSEDVSFSANKQQSSLNYHEQLMPSTHQQCILQSEPIPNQDNQATCNVTLVNETSPNATPLTTPNFMCTYTCNSYNNANSSHSMMPNVSTMFDNICSTRSNLNSAITDRYSHNRIKPAHVSHSSHNSVAACSITRLQSDTLTTSIVGSRPAQYAAPLPTFEYNHLHSSQDNRYLQMHPDPHSFDNIRYPDSQFRRPGHTISSNTSSVINDTAALHLIKQELFKKTANSFVGEAHKYHSWKNNLHNKTQGLNLTAWEMLQVLEANTSGKPLSVVQLHMSIGGPNPELTLRNVWKDLHEEFGSGTQIANSLIHKIEQFPQIKSAYQSDRLKELVVICQHIEANISVAPELELFNLSCGIRKIWLKLPENLQNSWRVIAQDFKVDNQGHQPHFAIFLNFLIRKGKEFGDPTYEKPTLYSEAKKNLPIGQSKTILKIMTPTSTETKDSSFNCVLHPNGQHNFVDCRSFIKLDIKEKRDLLKKHGRCFACLGKHIKSNCDQNPKCEKCEGAHVTVLHYDKRKNNIPTISQTESSTSSLCTRICKNSDTPKSCSKVLLVDLKIPSKSDKVVRCYSIIDEQSDCSFADPKIAELFGIDFPEINYSLITLNGCKTVTSGLLIEGMKIRGVKEKRTFALPKILTNSSIPDCKHEVATPNIVKSHPHIAYLSPYFNELVPDAEVLLLLGRDSGQLMNTKCIGHKPPFAHHTPLGWALVGTVCTGNSLVDANHCTLKVLTNHESFSRKIEFKPPPTPWKLPEMSSFKEFSDDELDGPSQDEMSFLKKINENIHVNDKGHLTMPLPFKTDDPKLPNNKTAVFSRTYNTLNRLKKDSKKLESCINAMQKSIDADHVEAVPIDEPSPAPGKAWWIPVFPVSHPKKEKTRIVFDSSAKFTNISLNDELLTGPDINNDLRTVLRRFREELIGFSADIEAMFYAFHLTPLDRDYTRFFWFADNSPNKPLVEYRARVHIFGNRPSPALANIGLRFAASHASPYSPKVEKFVSNHFYVDDAAGCTRTSDEAIAILSETRNALQIFNIRLHKICSNSTKVLNAFPKSEISTNTTVDLSENCIQPTLGLRWNTNTDTLTIHVALPHRPFTKRGVLSIINSLFDPLGFISPIVLAGRLIQRLLLPPPKSDSALVQIDWDDPLPTQYLSCWDNWKASVSEMFGFAVPRSYYPSEFGTVIDQELHVFCDASDNGTGHVIYLRSKNTEGQYYVAFVSGSSKLAPRQPPSIPRMELNAALDASVAALGIQHDLLKPISSVILYSDSKVVLGYIHNKSKRFKRYVSRRVNLIHKCFPVNCWNYVSTENNPADIASRPQTGRSLLQSSWFRGPSFLWESNDATKVDPVEYTTIDLPETEHVTLKTLAMNKPSHPLSTITSRISSLAKAIRTVNHVLNFCHKMITLVRRTDTGSKTNPSSNNSSNGLLKLISAAQQDSFSLEINLLKSKSELPSTSKLASLSPYLDDQGCIRVGGRLKYASIPLHEKFPLLLPPNHTTTRLIVRYHHNKVRHQGRQITLGEIRSAGYYILNGSNVIKKELNSCVICRKLRAPCNEQLMSDLPADRLDKCPPFTYTGLDVFGHFNITDGKVTRKNNALKKCWAVVFTCLVTRAIHIEPLPAMDTSTFINALRRFFSVRGICKKLRSDRGSNFIGACKNENYLLCMKDIEKEVLSHQCIWEFNPPSASHFGGVWERKIASIRRILEACILQMGPRCMTRDELYTFLQETCAIVNNTPLVPVSDSPDDPIPITPAMLLTLRDDPNPSSDDNYSAADLVSYGSKRWRRVQYLSEQFWIRWRRDYIQTLQTRKKWKHPKRNLQPNDIVMIKNDHQKRNTWPIGRVISVKYSNDGLVRSASVSVSNKDSKCKIYDRPIHKLVVILSTNEDTSSELS